MPERDISPMSTPESAQIQLEEPDTTTMAGVQIRHTLHEIRENSEAMAYVSMFFNILNFIILEVHEFS